MISTTLKMCSLYKGIFSLAVYMERNIQIGTLAQ